MYFYLSVTLLLEEEANTAAVLCLLVNNVLTRATLKLFLHTDIVIPSHTRTLPFLDKAHSTVTHFSAAPSFVSCNRKADC